MTESNFDNAQPLTPAAFHILLALVDQERHGYGIIREIEMRTGGQLRMAPGTLYGAISRMREDGWIEESEERPDPELDDQRRRYYRLTDVGRRVAMTEAQRLAALVESAVLKRLIPGSAQRVEGRA